MLTLAPTAMVPSVHVAVFPRNVHEVGSCGSVTWVGSWSVSVTVLAESGPWLVTVTV
jgi:hypothetical protein